MRCSDIHHDVLLMPCFAINDLLVMRCFDISSYICPPAEEATESGDSTKPSDSQDTPAYILDSCLPRLLQTMGLVFDKLIRGKFGRDAGSPRSSKIGAHYASSPTFAAFILVSGFKQIQACVEVLPRKVWVSGAADTQIAETPEELLLRIRKFLVDVVHVVAPHHQSNSLAREMLDAAIDLFSTAYKLWCPSPDLQTALLQTLIGSGGTDLNAAGSFLFEAAMNCCMEADAVLAMLSPDVDTKTTASGDEKNKDVIIPEGVSEDQWAKHIRALTEPTAHTETKGAFMQRIIDILGGSHTDDASHLQRARRVAARVLAKVQEEIVFTIDFNTGLDVGGLEEHVVARLDKPNGSPSWGCGSNDAISMQVMMVMSV